MKKIITILVLILATTLTAQVQQVNFGNNTPDNRTEWYIPNSPTNMQGNRTVVGWIKAIDMFYMKQTEVRFDAVSGTGDRFVYADNLGTLKTRPFTDFYLASNPNGYISSYTETDPTISAWAKASVKPSYTASEVGAYPAIGNPSNFLTSVPAQSWTSITGKPTFATVSTSGSYLDLSNRPTIKRQETYSGTTNASGQYIVTFGTAFAVAPNIQANIVGATDTQNIRITSVSTTGFTVLVRNRVDVIGLLPTWNNVTGATVDILVTDK